MVTKPKDVPWGDVEDLIDDLAQWLITNAAAPKPGKGVGPFGVACDALFFVQVATGEQVAPEASKSIRERQEHIAFQLGEPADLAAIAVFALAVLDLCMYNGRGLRGPSLQSTTNKQSARAKELLYDDAHIQMAEDAVRRIFASIEHARKKLVQALDTARKRHQALPELNAELSSVPRSFSGPGPEWPPYRGQQARELLHRVDAIESATQAVVDQFYDFFEIGAPRFPLTLSGWQALRRDVATRLEGVGWRFTDNGLQKSQSKST